MSIERDEHGDPLTLEPIVYEPVYDDAGRRMGWRVPESEREAWFAPPRPEPRKPVDEEARDIEDLVVELESLLWLDEQLERKLRAAHELEPLQVTRLAAALRLGVAEGRLRSPGGFLLKRLGELERRHT